MNFKLPFILSVVRDCSISEACIFDNFNPHVIDILFFEGVSSSPFPSLSFPSLLFSYIFPLFFSSKLLSLRHVSTWKLILYAPKVLSETRAVVLIWGNFSEVFSPFQTMAKHGNFAFGKEVQVQNCAMMGSAR